jgi:alkanesulfonate monooxygenase
MTQQCEIAWFSALCDDDYEFLGVPDPYLASSWEHCRNIVLTAEKSGFDNILLPSGYQLGLDTTMFAAAIAPMPSGSPTCRPMAARGLPRSG